MLENTTIYITDETGDLTGYVGRCRCGHDGPIRSYEGDADIDRLSHDCITMYEREQAARIAQDPAPGYMEPGEYARAMTEADYLLSVIESVRREKGEV